MNNGRVLTYFASVVQDNNHLCLAAMGLYVPMVPYEPKWNKLPCCSVNNTWHVCPFLRLQSWLGKILRVDFKASDILEPVSQPFLTACAELRAATGETSGLKWWKMHIFHLLQGLAWKVWPWPVIPNLCRCLQFFGREQTFLFSR